MDLKRGVAICHYNRVDYLEEIISAVYETTPPGTKIVVCDDGSKQEIKFNSYYGSTLIQGGNLGVAANKNRALWGLQDCHYLCILEDDLKPTAEGWFEIYEEASKTSGIHHFCRVQDKEEEEKYPEFDNYMGERGFTPIYGPSPRGDLTFLTQRVIREVGGFHPAFIGAGHAHGEWTARVIEAGLVPHPQRYVDIKEARDMFIQIGDTEGGRWLEDETVIKKQVSLNRNLLKKLQRTEYIYHPLVLS